MPWFKVDDGFHGHPKVVELSLAAVGIWTLTGSWCAKYLTDGLVGSKTIARMGGSDAESSELVDAELWIDTGDGFQFKDWHDYQPLKVDIEAERFAAQERMRAVRSKKKGVRDAFARTTPERSDEQPANVRPVFGRSSDDVRVTPSQPSPSPSQSPKKSAQKRKSEIALPDDWVPNETCKAYAAAESIDAAHEAGQFRAHAGANDRRQRDWDLAFRSWLGNAKKWAPAKKPTPTDRATATLGLATDIDMREIEQ